MASDGPPRPALLGIAAAALGLDESDAHAAARRATTVILPPVKQLNPFDEGVIEPLTEVLNTAATDSDVIIVDLGFDRTQARFGAVERLMLSVATSIAPIWPVGAFLVFLVGRLPDRRDDIAQILKLPGLGPATLFIDDEGERLGDEAEEWSRATAVSLAAVPTAEEERTAAARQTRRRRGVFKVATAAKEAYAAHKYSLPSADLARLLHAYFSAANVDIAVLDGVASYWLDEALLAVSADYESSVSCFSTHDLSPPPEVDDGRLNMHEELLAELDHADKRVCIVVPMVKHAHRAGELLTAMRKLGRADVSILAVFMSDLNGEPTTQVANGWASRVSLDTPQYAGDIDFFFDVSLRRLAPDSWEVRMAKLFHEQFEDDSEAWTPSRTGLWMLLNENGADSGYTQADHGVLMRMSLDHWDAGWLAECIMRQIESQPGAGSRDAMLIVVPDDTTAIADIAQALHVQQGVAVVAIPRTAFGHGAQVPQKVKEALYRFRGSEIVLVDESTARYSTMAELSSVVFDVVQEVPARQVVILELPEGAETRPSTLLSMTAWRPLDWHNGQHDAHARV